MATNVKTGQQTMEMKKSEFHQLFIDELKEMYWVEGHSTKTLVKMQKAATSKELSNALGVHANETATHGETLNRIFQILDVKPIAKKCPAMEGLFEEALAIIDDTEKETKVRDAGLILAAQKIEHYEIASYGTLRVFADTMGHQDISRLLSNILGNEKATDVTLTKIAESFINTPASRE